MGLPPDQFLEVSEEDLPAGAGQADADLPGPTLANNPVLKQSFWTPSFVRQQAQLELPRTTGRLAQVFQ